MSNKTQKPMGNAVKSPTKSLKSPGSAQAGTRCKATDLQEHVTKETTKPIAKNTSKLLSPATDSTLPISVGKQCNKSVTFVKEHIECVCCSDDRRCILKFPCGHLYCKICIGTLFKMALKDRSLIPVRCCDTPIDQSLTHLVLNDEDQRAYAEALEEVQAKRKMYW